MYCPGVCAILGLNYGLGVPLYWGGGVGFILCTGCARNFTACWISHVYSIICFPATIRHHLIFRPMSFKALIWVQCATGPLGNSGPNGMPFLFVLISKRCILWNVNHIHLSRCIFAVFLNSIVVWLMLSEMVVGECITRAFLPYFLYFFHPGPFFTPTPFYPLVRPIFLFAPAFAFSLDIKICFMSQILLWFETAATTSLPWEFVNSCALMGVSVANFWSG